MSQQINLYDPALLRKRELWTATNLAIAAGVLLLVVGGWGAALRAQLGRAEAEAQQLSPAVKSLQDQLVTVSSQISNAKADPRLEAELAAARNGLQLRKEVVAVLKKNMGEEAPSFAEFLRGFARQAPKGLWLTGFTIGNGGASMRINGRMLNPSLLPEYIGRLNEETAFRGRAFASLSISAPKEDANAAAPAVQPPATAGSPAPAQPASAASANYLEFTLVPAPLPGEPVRRSDPLQRPSERGQEAEGAQ